MDPALILQVARAAGRQLSGPHSNGEHLIQCPRPEKHKNRDAHPSCRLNAEKGTFYCDPCGEGGGIKKFAEALGVDLRCLFESLGRQSGSRSSRSTPKMSLCFNPSRPIRQATQRLLAEKFGKVYRPERWQAFGVLEGRVWPEGRSQKAEHSDGRLLF